MSLVEYSCGSATVAKPFFCTVTILLRLGDGCYHHLHLIGKNTETHSVPHIVSKWQSWELTLDNLTLETSSCGLYPKGRERRELMSS